MNERDNIRTPTLSHPTTHRRLFGAAALLILGSAAATAHAQWTVTDLHPAGMQDSYAYGVAGAQQGGWSVMGFVPHASLWSGSASSWVDLNPAGLPSFVYGVSANQQVGVTVNGQNHAAMWSGSAVLWVDLNPAAASDSIAEGVWGGQQVGRATFTGVTHAGLWTGAAASWVDLNPVGAYGSEAHGVWGGQQVGGTVTDGIAHAALWSGTAASWVDLHPAGADWSEAWAIGGGQQAGRAWVNGTSHAALWSGSAASWVDLSPPDATYSWAYGVSGGRQVGYVSTNSGTHAALWSGSAASHVDLHAFLPANFADSRARGIWTDAGHTYVAGYAYNRTTNQVEPILWTQATLCAADFNHDGSANSQDFFDFLAAFFAGSPAADFNHDGAVNSQDFFDFLGAFFTGC